MAFWWVALEALYTAFTDKLYETLAERGLTLATSQYSVLSSVETEIDNLTLTLTQIHALLADAHDRRFIEDHTVLLWLRRLNDVAFDAQDLLDDFQTDLNKHQIQSLTRKRKWYNHFFVFSTDPILLKRRRTANQISDLRDRLDNIHKDRESLRLRNGDAIRRRISTSCDSPVAGALQDSQQIRGRDLDVDHLVKLLKLDDGRKLPVISLTGLGGMGKTALAGLVFQDTRIVDHFKMRIWVSAMKDMDETAATIEIIEAITKKKCDALSLNNLQLRLADLVRGKKFLLVVDNVCREDGRFWETVRVPLLGSEVGSKVMVTTRSEKVAIAMSGEPPISVKGLGVDYCWLLFRERAFANGQVEQRNLVEIGMKIVGRCHGSPLAAKSLGGLLYKVTDEDEWRSVLTEMWELEENENHILVTLKVSYDHLPLHLKQCFGYCSIFPNGFEFDKDELVKLWMAEGFIKPRGSRRLETIGGKYFNDLLWRSFFQKSDSHNKSKYTMPSFIYDLAQYVSSYECLRMEQNVQHNGSRKPRYASISHRYLDAVVFYELCGYESLRTLLLHSECRMPLNQVLHGVCAKFRFLRTLDLKNSKVEVLPKSIGDLKHMRYLSLYNTQIKTLPETICNLYNLQSLELGECYRLLELPEGTSNLVNLRHLGLHVDWNKETDLRSMPPGIGRLTSLQTLSRFSVTSGNGCGIGELKDLNLRGELCILKLENVCSLREAKEANLEQKQYIESLMLCWSSATHTNAQGGVDGKAVIKKLHPHTNLRNLRIQNYNGIDFPSWIEDPSFTNLESLTLSNCKRCQIFPQLKQLPRLTNLYIEEMWRLESISNLPPELTRLELRNCGKLSTLPELHSLRDLVVEGGNEAIFRWSCSLTGLSSLTISRFQGLKSVSGSCFQHLSSLKNLKIEECNRLVSFAESEGLQHLTSLESLEIKSCPELTSLPGYLHLLASLHRLELWDAPKIRSLPEGGLSSGLQNLSIGSCPLLQQRCYRERGLDWAKIKHIPYLDIGPPR